MFKKLCTIGLLLGVVGGCSGGDGTVVTGVVSVISSPLQQPDDASAALKPEDGPRLSIGAAPVVTIEPACLFKTCTSGWESSVNLQLRPLQAPKPEHPLAAPLREVQSWAEVNPLPGLSARVGFRGGFGLKRAAVTVVYKRWGGNLRLVATAKAVQFSAEWGL